MEFPGGLEIEASCIKGNSRSPKNFEALVVKGYFKEVITCVGLAVHPNVLSYLNPIFDVQCQGMPWQVSLYNGK